MKKFRHYIYQSSADFTRAMLWEAKYIFRDRAVFFSFVIVAVLVSFLYTYLYSEETLQELPIGVVDEDNTSQSRQLQAGTHRCQSLGHLPQCWGRDEAHFCTGQTPFSSS